MSNCKAVGTPFHVYINMVLPSYTPQNPHVNRKSHRGVLLLFVQIMTVFKVTSHDLTHWTDQFHVQEFRRRSHYWNLQTNTSVAVALLVGANIIQEKTWIVAPPEVKKSRAERGLSHSTSKRRLCRRQCFKCCKCSKNLEIICSVATPVPTWLRCNKNKQRAGTPSPLNQP